MHAGLSLKMYILTSAPSTIAERLLLANSDTRVDSSYSIIEWKGATKYLIICSTFCLGHLRVSPLNIFGRYGFPKLGYVHCSFCAKMI